MRDEVGLVGGLLWSSRSRPPSRGAAATFPAPEQRRRRRAGGRWRRQRRRRHGGEGRRHGGQRRQHRGQRWRRRGGQRWQRGDGGGAGGGAAAGGAAEKKGGSGGSGCATGGSAGGARGGTAARRAAPPAAQRPERAEARAAAAAREVPLGAGGGLSAPAASGAVVIDSDFSSTSLSLLSTQGSAGARRLHTLDDHRYRLEEDLRRRRAPIAAAARRQDRVDRPRNTALTFINPDACMVIRQLLGEGRLQPGQPARRRHRQRQQGYVTRYGRNPAPATPLAAGDDVRSSIPRDENARSTASIYRRTGRRLTAATARPGDHRGREGGRDAEQLSSDLARTTSAAWSSSNPAPIRSCSSCRSAAEELRGPDYPPSTATVLVACGGSFGSTEQALDRRRRGRHASTLPPDLARRSRGSRSRRGPSTSRGVWRCRRERPDARVRLDPRQLLPEHPG